MRRQAAIGHDVPCRERSGGSPSDRANIGDVAAVERRRRGQAGWLASFPVAQAPNAPLLAALAGRAVAAATPRGRVHDLGHAVFVLGLFVWSCEEATSGVNWFRRLLGVAGLVRIVGAAARRPWTRG